MMLVMMEATLLTAVLIADAELRDDRCARDSCDAALPQLRNGRKRFCRTRTLVGRFFFCAGHALELMMSMVPTMLLMIVVNVHADVRDACCAI